MSGAEIGPLILAAVTLLAGYALRQHHERKKLELRQEYAQFAGWVRRKIRMSDEVWECPRCAQPCFSWKALEQHQNPEQSPCAWLYEHPDELADLIERARQALRNAGEDDTGGPEGVTGWHVSATMETGPDDTEPPPEGELDSAEREALEQFENRAEGFRVLMNRINKP